MMLGRDVPDSNQSSNANYRNNTLTLVSRKNPTPQNRPASNVVNQEQLMSPNSQMLLHHTAGGVQLINLKQLKQGEMPQLTLSGWDMMGSMTPGVGVAGAGGARLGPQDALSIEG